MTEPKKNYSKKSQTIERKSKTSATQTVVVTRDQKNQSKVKKEDVGTQILKRPTVEQSQQTAKVIKVNCETNTEQVCSQCGENVAHYKNTLQEVGTELQSVSDLLASLASNDLVDEIREKMYRLQEMISERETSSNSYEEPAFVATATATATVTATAVAFAVKTEVDDGTEFVVKSEELDDFLASTSQGTGSGLSNVKVEVEDGESGETAGQEEISALGEFAGRSAPRKRKNGNEQGRSRKKGAGRQLLGTKVYEATWQ